MRNDPSPWPTARVDPSGAKEAEREVTLKDVLAIKLLLVISHNLKVEMWIDNNFHIMDKIFSKHFK